MLTHARACCRRSSRRTEEHYSCANVANDHLVGIASPQHHPYGHTSTPRSATGNNLALKILNRPTGLEGVLPAARALANARAAPLRLGMPESGTFTESRECQVDDNDAPTRARVYRQASSRCRGARRRANLCGLRVCWRNCRNL